MHTLLTAPGRHDHPPQQVETDQQPTTRTVRRVGLADRIALRLGLALLVWARRPAKPARAARAARTERYVTAAEASELQNALYSTHHLRAMGR